MANVWYPHKDSKEDPVYPSESGNPWAVWGKQAQSAPHTPGEAWSPDSLFNLERTLFAVFFIWDLGSSSSSLSLGKLEGGVGRHPGLPTEA